MANLRELVAKWKKRADLHVGGSEFNDAVGQAILGCAVDLDKVLKMNRCDELSPGLLAVWAAGFVSAIRTRRQLGTGTGEAVGAAMEEAHTMVWLARSAAASVRGTPTPDQETLLEVVEGPVVEPDGPLEAPDPGELATRLAEALGGGDWAAGDMLRRVRELVAQAGRASRAYRILQGGGPDAAENALDALAGS